MRTECGTTTPIPARGGTDVKSVGLRLRGRLNSVLLGGCLLPTKRRPSDVGSSL